MIDYVKFSHIPVRDQDRALAFYRDLLGFEVAQDRPYGQGIRWIEMGIPGARTRLWFSVRPDDVPSREPTQILITTDVQAEYERLRAAGVAFEQAPTTAPWAPDELYAMFRDSEGNLLVLGQHVA